MKINYLILAHKNPNQIESLLNRFGFERNLFFIHIDQNCKPTDFLVLEKYNSLHISNQKFPGTWGDIGIVKATLALLQMASEINPEGRMVLLSGQDYPVKSNAYINDFFSKNQTVDFIDMAPANTVFPTEWKIRLQHYKYNLSHRRGNYALIPPITDIAFYSFTTLKYLAKIGIRKPSIYLKKFFWKNLITPRKTELEAFGGGQWWSFTAKTAQKVLDFCDNHPEFIAYHENSLLPDELFFQTIIHQVTLANPEIEIQNSLTYVDWSRKNVSLPVTFTKNDFEILRDLPENKLFARKFDCTLDTEIFDALDSLH